MKQKAGREFDIMIAEKVMGYYWVDVPKDYYGLNESRTLVPPTFVESNYSWPNRGKVAPYFGPAYSTSIEAAWTVVEKLLQRKHGHVDLSIELAGVACDYVSYYTDASALAPTAPLAICLAALKAVTKEES